MFDLSVKLDLGFMERELLKAVGEDARRFAASRALTRVAAAARVEVMKQLPQVFDRPTPFTMHSIRYLKATKETLESSVYVSDDASRGLSPRKYLGPEIAGGARNFKRSEVLFQNVGVMARANQIAPSTRFPLDQYGNIPGREFTKILSRLKAFGDQGFTANVSGNRKKRLAMAKRSVATSGTEYFVAHSKRGGLPLGIWRLVGPGHVEPVLIFTERQAQYRTRLPFREIVAEYARKHLGDEVMRALLEEFDGRRG